MWSLYAAAGAGAGVSLLLAVIVVALGSSDPEGIVGQRDALPENPSSTRSAASLEAPVSEPAQRDDTGAGPQAENAGASISSRPRHGHEPSDAIQLASATVPEPVPPQPARRLTNSIGMELALIPAGRFLMGSPETEAGRSEREHQHPVEISQSWYCGVHEVTQQEFRAVMGRNPSWFAETGKGRDKVSGESTDRFPVEWISQAEAMEFCARLSAAPAERSAGRLYRLPTEAEWEYACRGGVAGQPYSCGEFLSSRDANVRGGAADGPSLDRTTRIDSYEPNGFGLYGIHGNVSEWCLDRYDESYYLYSPERDPQGPAHFRSAHVVRGGAWCYAASGARSAHRFCRPFLNRDTESHYRSNYVGFRVVCLTSGSSPQTRPADALAAALTVPDRPRKPARNSVAPPAGEAPSGDALFPFAFEKQDLDGRQISLAELRGKVVIVDLWGTWCPPCRRLIPHLVQLKQEHADSGLEVVGISFERQQGSKAAAAVRKFHREHKMNYPCLLGDRTIKEQVPEFRGYPTMLLIDRQGRVRQKLGGYRSYEALEPLVRELLDEEPDAS